MGAVRKIDDAPSKRPPATSPQKRTRELVGLAHDLAEKQLRDGTASAQVQVHFLKMASEENALQREKLAHENALLQVKKAQIEADSRQEAVYGEVIEALSRYRGEHVSGSDG